jgi:hypothetical protein
MTFRIVNEQVRENAINEIKKLPLNSYQVKIEEIRRSNPQNSLYWKWIQVIGNHLGYEKDDLHEAFKRQFIGIDQGADMFGNLYLMPKSSAKLKKAEFSTYMNKIQAFALNEGIFLPQPDYYGDDKCI